MSAAQESDDLDHVMIFSQLHHSAATAVVISLVILSPDTPEQSRSSHRFRQSSTDSHNLTGSADMPAVTSASLTWYCRDRSPLPKPYTPAPDSVTHHFFQTVTHAASCTFQTFPFCSGTWLSSIQTQTLLMFTQHALTSHRKLFKDQLEAFFGGILCYHV